MKTLRRILIVLVALVLLVALLGAGAVLGFLWLARDAGAGYIAKRMASGVFVAHRTPESMANEELGFIPFFHYDIDEDQKTVTGWIFPDTKKTAVYRDGLGVAIAHDGDIAKLKAQARPNLIPDLSALKDKPWPMGDAPSGKPAPTGFDQAKLDAAVDKMFAEPNPLRKRNTRAVIVVYKDEIVAERYAPEFGPEQRFPAWSMTKSFTQSLFGIAVRDGKINIHDRAPIPEWANDERSEITIDCLLRMSSGVAFDEHDMTPPTADLTTMLFLRPGAGEYAISLPLKRKPDTLFEYGSSTTNVLSVILRQAYNDDDVYYALPYKELFSKIGMRSAYMEADATGTFVGSSFLFATARDFVRFGILYEQDGVWQGERILPEGWVEYARTTTPTAPNENYGAHWWRPSLDERAAAKARGVPLPEDTFHASGFEGQKLVIMPSRQLIILRLGLCYFSSYPFYDQVCDVLEAFPQSTPID
ncbi:MAG: serine hydrolase [Candidatus Hydrogenedentes bacterium]|nr:serine hydrolase [Candidatus Hydrogenedentota bacterium]